MRVRRRLPGYSATDRTDTATNQGSSRGLTPRHGCNPRAGTGAHQATGYRPSPRAAAAASQAKRSYDKKCKYGLSHNKASLRGQRGYWPVSLSLTDL